MRPTLCSGCPPALAARPRTFAEQPKAGIEPSMACWSIVHVVSPVSGTRSPVLALSGVATLSPRKAMRDLHPLHLVILGGLLLPPLTTTRWGGGAGAGRGRWRHLLALGSLCATSPTLSSPVFVSAGAPFGLAAGTPAARLPQLAGRCRVGRRKCPTRSHNPNFSSWEHA